MSYWKDNLVDMGDVKRKTERKVLFLALPNIPDIAKITGSCGCTDVKMKDRILTATYKAGEIPNHITADTQPIKVYITVAYKDGTQEILTLIGVKTR